MTVQGAIEEIVKETCQCCETPTECKWCEYKIAIECMQEVEQYRALGTVEELTNQKHNLSVAYKCIEELQQPKTDWIPCEERLPELNEGTEYFKQSEVCLVAVEWWDKDITEDVGWYNQNGAWNHDSKNCKVIAWQPLQPYKKEGAE